MNGITNKTLDESTDKNADCELSKSFSPVSAWSNASDSVSTKTSKSIKRNYTLRSPAAASSKASNLKVSQSPLSVSKEFKDLTYNNDMSNLFDGIDSLSEFSNPNSTNDNSALSINKRRETIDPEMIENLLTSIDSSNTEQLNILSPVSSSKTPTQASDDKTKSGKKVSQLLSESKAMKSLLSGLDNSDSRNSSIVIFI